MSIKTSLLAAWIMSCLAAHAASANEESLLPDAFAQAQRFEQRGEDSTRDTKSWVFVAIHLPNVTLDFSEPYTLYRSYYWENLGTLLRLWGWGEASDSAEPTTSIEIGHIQLGWNCQIPLAGQDKPYQISGAAGQTGDNQYNSFKLIRNGMGMTPLFLTYEDGTLEGPAAVQSRISARPDQVAILPVEVSPSECLTVAQRVESYRSSHAFAHFGLLENPGKNEGAVCWSFVQAMSQGIGALESLFDSYHLKLGVPNELMGRLPSEELSKLSPEAKLPKALDDLPLRQVSFEEFNTPIYWQQPESASVRYESFDFQSFREDFQAGFEDCQNPWCLRYAPKIVKNTSIVHQNHLTTAGKSPSGAPLSP
jgi:hypothetical protein